MAVAVMMGWDGQGEREGLGAIVGGAKSHSPPAARPRSENRPCLLRPLRGAGANWGPF